MFNALKYTQELEGVGFTREQAEKSVKILMEIMQENLATKQDIKELELRMTINLGSLIVLTVGVMTAIAKLI